MLSYARRHIRVPIPRDLLGHRTRQVQRAIAGLSERHKEFESKYADKLLERVKREGVSTVEELKIKVKVSTPQLRPPEQSSLQKNLVTSKVSSSSNKAAFGNSVRKDSSPVKPLADLMDIRKVLAKNHTAEHVSTLWTAYHATRSQGTGRGYLSATIPLKTYLEMMGMATSYPTFLLPLPRASPESQETAHEFYFLQWGFHGAPPHPSQIPSLPFKNNLPSPPASTVPNPTCTTVLFTPLQEYKLRQTFAQPYLVLTHYTDLAMTHGVVLMRGEVTASPSSGERYLLSQADAQLLAMGVQRFYLTTGDEGSARRAEMLRKFHEVPAEFQWKELLAFGSPTVP